ncbi:hypothetical protein NQZ68_040525 [Dissostichus eleginoides]|nr:hypothetical protein NQZ68_040525 [Dissostichus eleginoides]
MAATMKGAQFRAKRMTLSAEIDQSRASLPEQRQRDAARGPVLIQETGRREIHAFIKTDFITSCEFLDVAVTSPSGKLTQPLSSQIASLPMPEKESPLNWKSVCLKMKGFTPTAYMQSLFRHLPATAHTVAEACATQTHSN